MATRSTSWLLALVSLVGCATPRRAAEGPRVVEMSPAVTPSVAEAKTPETAHAPSPSAEDAIDALFDRASHGIASASELEALGAAEREAFARRANAFVDAPPPMAPLRPVITALAHAFSPGAERGLVRLAAHNDTKVRELARELIYERGLSAAALVSGVERAGEAPEIVASLARVLARAGGARPEDVVDFCKDVPGSGEAAWECLAARAVAGDTEGRKALGRRVVLLARQGELEAVAARLDWLVYETGEHGPWQEIAGEIDNGRRAPPVRCIPHSWCGTCEVSRRMPRPPLGDTIARAIVRGAKLQVGFDPNASVLTPAARAEVKRKVLARRAGATTS